MRPLPVLCTVILISFGGILSSFDRQDTGKPMHFPYKQAGLTERQAAAHLLNRFTFGPTPGQVDEVVKTGLEKWFALQLDGGLADDSLNSLLSGYNALALTNTQVVNTYPKGAKLLRMAIQDGFIDKDSVNKDDKKLYRSRLQAYMEQKGLKPQQELFRQFINQKILRAAVGNNQLHEVLTDFWFNHFNVSISKNDCAEYIPAYERDVIRPNVLGTFESLLLATAKSPAMLYYLDNFSSAANADANGQPPLKRRLQRDTQMGDTSGRGTVIKKLQNAKKAQGLNENYAREVMELHTLGVDGGYTQKDVTEAARVLTGWTVYPMNDYGGGNAIVKIIERVGWDKLQAQGFVHEGDFLFAANRHDKKEKVVMGTNFAANGGYAEGVSLLKMLAHHASTSRFISRKLAIRFVSDNPPQSLVDKMAKTFTDKGGDIREVLISMVSSPEFWKPDVVREKTKSPFELAISAVRSLRADIRQPFQLYNWVSKMGQRMYYYQAPTGFPDRGQYWINTGALLNRMNFGLALASQRIPGIRIDLAALNHYHEPESAEAALKTYSSMVMPERRLEETIKRLTPLLNDPELEKKVDEAAGKTAVQPAATAMNEDVPMSDDAQGNALKEKPGKKGTGKNEYARVSSTAGDNSMLSQVVGIIIGSPEFQRR